MADSNETQIPNSSAKIRTLIDKTETDFAQVKERISSLETKRDENIMDDALCEAIEDDMSKAEKEGRRLEVRIRHLQEKLKEITKRENEEAAHRKVAEAKLAADMTADLIKQIYVRAAREIAAVMYYYELAKKKSERAWWYCDQAGIKKCNIPSPTKIIRNVSIATEEIPSMCNLPDIYEEDKAYWTPGNGFRSRPLMPRERGISGPWRKHEINLPDFDEIQKAKNPEAMLLNVIKRYATTGQTVDFPDPKIKENPSSKTAKKTAG